MDTLIAVVSHPFVWGLSLGLLIALFVLIQAMSRGRELRERIRESSFEVSKLRSHLHTQMEILAKGNESMKAELEEARKFNENLRITNSTLMQKPGRAELRMLHTYERAVRLMTERAPGFALGWENALQEAEHDVEMVEKGFLPMVKRVFRPSLYSGDMRKALQDTSDS